MTDKPLTMYDVSLDEFRAVTQEDVDRLNAMGQRYGRLRHGLANAVEMGTLSPKFVLDLLALTKAH